MTLAEKLATAQAAYHDIMTGKAPRVIVDQNGERIEYSPANASRLNAYILELKRQIGGVGNTIGGPMEVWI